MMHGEVLVVSPIRARKMNYDQAHPVRLPATNEPGDGKSVSPRWNRKGLRYSVYEVRYFICQGLVSRCRLLQYAYSAITRETRQGRMCSGRGRDVVAFFELRFTARELRLEFCDAL
jgi:hypothetical protein